MKSFDNILFPIDLSESSERIVPYVRSVAEKYDAKIHMLFAARVFEYFAGIYVAPASIGAMQDDIVEGAEKAMNEFVETHFGDSPGETTATVVSGDATEKIMEYIHSHVIDLIIMGTHGRKGLDKIIMGSVAERVVRTSPVPVMVVSPFKMVQ